MAGQLYLFLCVVISIQWCSAQMPWGQFSGINGFNPLPFGGGMNRQMGGQPNADSYQYVNCAAVDQNQDDLKVTFSRPTPQNDMLQRQFPWLRQPPTNTDREPVRMEFSIKSAGQQLAGNMMLVMTEFGPAQAGMCNPALLGSIKQGFSRNQLVGFNNPWNPSQSFSPNNNQPAGQLGPGFFLQPGQSYQISRNVEINFNEMSGSGIALCRGVGGNTCSFMLPLCCTLAKGSRPVATSMTQNNQFGNDPFSQGGFNGQAGGFNGQTGGFSGQGADPFASNTAATGGTTGMVFP